ncbi:riboflavin kinase [Candidatus Kaiserbacteria bacterium]|nr:riboflavin kinase [Candidatus Kaiserbacteria bacterium]
MRRVHRTFTGIVGNGSKTAAKLGFPTLNIPLGDADVSGIYAGMVEIGGAPYMAAIFADPKRNLLEAHLLDFSADAYGKDITVELHEKIRDRMDFENESKLIAAIAKDIADVRQYFREVY